jgi:hypothetical protein
MMKSQKELKEEYRQRKEVGGVFQIKNTVGNKIFIGSYADLNAAQNSQLFQLRIGSHPNTALQEDYNQLGAGNFTFEILAEHPKTDDPNVDFRKELKKLEQMFIEELQPFGDNGYNSRKV